MCIGDMEGSKDHPVRNAQKLATSLAQSAAIQSEFPVSYFHRYEIKRIYIFKVSTVSYFQRFEIKMLYLPSLSRK